ncbi:hypothetical protein [Amphibacillus indicireducens]|uniref:Uncharacterized protein n=1 Tax=Amphibacillus indicireducens TaxID=1076330 RepID=A0ABP7VIW4_9BACI
MIKIQTMADVHALEADEQLPSLYVEEIKNQFLIWYEAENEGESLDEFSLPSYSCIYHFDREEDMQVLIDHMNALEFVDVEKIEGQKYFRIGLMQDHQMSLIYFLERTLPRKTERWLES